MRELKKILSFEKVIHYVAFILQISLQIKKDSQQPKL